MMKANAGNVLKYNYETLLYANNMLKALDRIPSDSIAFKEFEKNLHKQELNISEPGEKDMTVMLRNDFELLKSHRADDSLKLEIGKNIKVIIDLNQEAILRKNKIADIAAETAITWLTVIFTILALVSFVMVINFPSVISNPVRILSQGISAIAGKDYKKRIHLQQKDEFGELANAFNSMAEKLDEYEHSNLDKIMVEKSRIDTIINQMKDGIIGFDNNRNILFINAVAQALLGLKEEQVKGKYAADVAITNDLLRKLLQEEDGKELKIYADNKQSYFNKDVLDVRNKEEIIGQVIVLRNITPFYELNEAKTNFIATVSHELKTPISSIKMSAKLLTDDRIGIINTEQKELIKSIQDDSERLLNITAELLNLSQAETGNINLNIQPSDPQQIINYAKEAVKTQREQKNIKLQVYIPDVLPRVIADVEKTSWVMTNFLSNAIRYSYNNAVIEVKAKIEKGYLKFSVQDFGVGIAPEYKDKIFNRYFRVPGSQKDGTGLGLAICKDFIEAQEGNIWVESEVGIGSTFTFSLQLAVEK